MTTHIAQAVIVDKDLQRRFPNIERPPTYIEFEIEDLNSTDPLEHLFQEHAARHRGGHYPHEDDIEIRLFSIRPKDE